MYARVSPFRRALHRDGRTDSFDKVDRLLERRNS